jgi:hypothetical protein
VLVEVYLFEFLFQVLDAYLDFFFGGLILREALLRLMLMMAY